MNINGGIRGIAEPQVFNQAPSVYYSASEILGL